MVQLQLSSGNTTTNTNMAQPSKGISKNIAKPFPNLPQSKLHLQFFPLQALAALATCKLLSSSQISIGYSIHPSSSKKMIDLIMAAFKGLLSTSNSASSFLMQLTCCLP